MLKQTNIMANPFYSLNYSTFTLYHASMFIVPLVYDRKLTNAFSLLNRYKFLEHWFA
jgi:hypothetical protein